MAHERMPRLPKQGGEKMEKHSMECPKEAYSLEHEGDGNMNYLNVVDRFSEENGKKVRKSLYKFSRYY